MKERQMRIAIAGTLAILAIGGLFYFLKDGSTRTEAVSVPQDFVLARQNAAAVSQHIVDLTTRTREKIDAAHAAERSGDAEKTKLYIGEARAANDEAYRNAASLADFLKTLAGSLMGVQSTGSQRIAYQAIAVELSLVSEFITYTQHLNSFLDALTRSLEAGNGGSRSEIDAALKTTNASAKKINELNSDFLERMEDFDSSLH